MTLPNHIKKYAEEFKNLMGQVEKFLNNDARQRPQYYAQRGGNPLEDDVVYALNECAKGTVFQDTVEKISGQKFPDIVVADYYGIEVKSTKDNHWTSTGSSILETTRVKNVEVVYMVFGKLGGEHIEFVSKPYENCLSGIAVTHMPRYLIDMRLNADETIFAKMGISYETLRKMDNPVSPVSKYYRKLLKPGESLWWTGDSVDTAVSAKIRLWKNLSQEEKSMYTIYGCVNFPEVFGGNYDAYALWLTSQGIVDAHIRDQFSSGGKEEMILSTGEKVKFPAVYRRIKKYSSLFTKRMAQAEPDSLVGGEMLNYAATNQRFLVWANLVSKEAEVEYNVSMDALKEFFWELDGGKFSWLMKNDK